MAFRKVIERRVTYVLYAAALGVSTRLRCDLAYAWRVGARTEVVVGFQTVAANLQLVHPALNDCFLLAAYLTQFPPAFQVRTGRGRSRERPRLDVHSARCQDHAKAKQHSPGAEQAAIGVQPEGCGQKAQASETEKASKANQPGSNLLCHESLSISRGTVMITATAGNKSRRREES